MAKRGRKSANGPLANGRLETRQLESWLWDAACSIRGALDAPKFKDYILPLIFIKRLSDVFDDEIDRLAQDLGDRETALDAAEGDRELIRFWVPAEARWAEIRRTTRKIGEKLTDAVRALARENPGLHGVIDIVDFNAAISGERIVAEEKLSSLIETISRHRLGLKDVQTDILGHAYEYLLKKFAEGQGQSAGEFFTPPEVAWVMAYAMDPKEGEEVYDPCCGSGGLLIKCELALVEKVGGRRERKKDLKLFGQEQTATTFAVAKMNTIIHDMEAEIAIGDTMRAPKFLDGSRLRRFDVVVTNPMWNQPGYDEKFYDQDPHERFRFGTPITSKADWGWVQHVLASLKDHGRAAIVLDTGAVTRGSGSQGSDREKEIRALITEMDWIEAVLLLPENLFYNTPSPGIVLFLNKAKPKKHRRKILLVNASKEFEKGQPKNFLPEYVVTMVANTIHKWNEDDGFSRVITVEEAMNKDYNLLPSRYIETVENTSLRPIGHIIYDLNQAESNARKVDAQLRDVLGKLGLNAEAYND